MSAARGQTLRRALGLGAGAAALVAVAALATACAGPDRGAAYLRAFGAAEQSARAGRFDEAARHYDEAAAGAKVPRDREHARYLAARMLARAGDAAAAGARMDAIANATPPVEDSADAAYQRAELSIEHGDEADGWGRLEAMVLRFPSSGVAPRALRRLVRHDDDTIGPRAALDHLRRLEPRLTSTELGELVAYEIALHRLDLGDVAGGRDALIGVAHRWPYPGGALWDDALYKASQLDERLGRYDAAVADLEEMLRERETSHIMGTYQRPMYTPALVRVGILYRDRLHDRARAREAFHRLYADFTTSVNRDDALWEESRLWEDDGDHRAACDRLRTLVHDFPESRYVPCAADLCGVARPSSTRAPATCHPYILRARYGQEREPHDANADASPPTGGTGGTN